MATGQVTPAQIAAMARARGLDPRAVLAVARQEGLGGGIGDAGTSFGPWQLHEGGAYPTSAPRDPTAANQWAWSPQGVGYALDRISGVAKGLSGREAVNAIVSRFERPANPGREIAGALAAYGNGIDAGAAVAASEPGFQPPSPQAGPDRSALAQSLLNASNSNDYSGFFQKVAQARQAAAAPVASAPLTAHENLPALPGTNLGARIARTALTQIGKPYQWGGQATLGHATDCSGLLQASAAANGIRIGRTTYQQWKEGSPVPLNQLQAGDAVFFHPGPNGPEHVAIYIGGGRVVEDPHSGATVEISQLAGRGPVGARRYG